jgi:uncharacterized membrane protein
MKKCFILSGLFLNLVGVVLLFFGLRADKSDGLVTAVDVKTKKTVKEMYLVRISPVLLKMGLALICLGLLLQFYGTC